MGKHRLVAAGVAMGESAVILGALSLADPDSPGKGFVLTLVGFMVSVALSFLALRSHPGKRLVVSTVLGSSLVWGVTLASAGFAVFLIEGGWGALAGVGSLGLAYGMVAGAFFGLGSMIWAAKPVALGLMIGILVWVVLYAPSVLGEDMPLTGTLRLLPILALIGALAAYVTVALLPKLLRRLGDPSAPSPVG